MQVELSNEDIQLLCTALDAWERESQTTGMMTSVLMAALTPPEGRDQFKSEQMKVRSEADFEAKARKQTSIILQAKLMQATMFKVQA